MRMIPSIDDLAAVWRLLVVRSAIVLALGIAAAPWPTATIVGWLVLMATVALVAALFDAAISGALHTRLSSAWTLLPEAALGVLLGGAILLYPVVPLPVLALLLSAWMLMRGVILFTVVRGVTSDRLIVTLAVGWMSVSVFAPVALLVHWSEAGLASVLAMLVAYVLVWSAAELMVGLHLRQRVRAHTPERVGGPGPTAARER